MAYEFSDEDKAATDDFQERIAFGVSEVTLVGAVAGETEAGKDYLEIIVADKDGTEDSARVWFTGGASPYSFQTVRQIVVHTAKSDADKEKARMAVENTKNTDELAELINSKCEGKQLWFTKFYSPDRTYTNSNGETKRSIDSRVYGYLPKDHPELMPSDEGTGNAAVDSAFPGATAEPSAAIPADDAWGNDDAEKK